MKSINWETSKKTLIKIQIILAITMFSNISMAQIPFDFSFFPGTSEDMNINSAKKLELLISLSKDSINGNVVYKEKLSTPMNENGEINLLIGKNNAASISLVDWQHRIFYIKVLADLNLDGNYEQCIVNQVLGISTNSRISESDPIFMGSVSSSISSNDTSKWNNLVRKHEHFVGELFGGGIVYWVTPDGQHGLIASLSDLCEGKLVKWTPKPYEEIYDAQSYTDGLSNTAAILKSFSDKGYPAPECSNYKVGTYDDWYLPSCMELQLMLAPAFLINKILSEDGDPKTNGITLINNIREYGRYWSSTKHTANAAYIAFFTMNKMDFDRNDTYARVRAIRKF